MVKIDLTYLESIAGGDEVFIKQMLEMFRISTLPEVERIEQYYADKDWHMVSAVAHKIKAPVQMLGQNELMNKVLIIEKNARDKVNLDAILALIREVKSELQNVNSSVDQLIKTM